MKTFLEVESKIGPIPVPVSQFRPPLPDINPYIGKNNVTEKRKRATPNKFRPATPKPTAVHPPLPEAPPKPKNDVPLPSIPVCESTPWPGMGKMSGNLLEEEFKTGEQPTEKCSCRPGCPFYKSQEQKEEQGKMQPQKLSPKANSKPQDQKH